MKVSILIRAFVAAMQAFQFLFLIVLVFPKDHLKADDEIQKMKSKYQSVKSLKADFTQSLKNITLGKTKNSSGHIYIMRPNMFRWETVEPENSLLSGNGKKVWYYTPPFQKGERGQVIVRSAQDVQSRLALDLLVGGDQFQKNFDYRRIEPLHYRLNPLKPSGDVDHIELFLERQTNLVYKVQLVSTSGNETTIILKNVVLDPKLDVSLFTFRIPPQTEVVQ